MTSDNHEIVHDSNIYHSTWQELDAITATYAVEVVEKLLEGTGDLVSMDERNNLVNYLHSRFMNVNLDGVSEVLQMSMRHTLLQPRDDIDG